MKKIFGRIIKTVEKTQGTPLCFLPVFFNDYSIPEKNEEKSLTELQNFFRRREYKLSSERLLWSGEFGDHCCLHTP